MYGTPVEITPLGDLLMWSGLVSLSVLITVAILVPRRWRRAADAAERQ
jgi:hypothetical protein